MDGLVKTGLTLIHKIRRKMDIETLEKANELAKSITQTENALKDINEFIDYARAGTTVGSKFDWTSQSKLIISEYEDGRGYSVDFGGYHDNLEILKAIKVVLEGRLERYQTFFENL